jgi:hypothetical protein
MISLTLRIFGPWALRFRRNGFAYRRDGPMTTWEYADGTDKEYCYSNGDYCSWMRGGELND